MNYFSLFFSQGTAFYYQHRIKLIFLNNVSYNKKILFVTKRINFIKKYYM